MLTESAYMTGLIAYVVAAMAALWLFRRWLLSRAPRFLQLIIILPLAALLLTPAYSQPGGETMAPALIVATFQSLTAGAEGAAHALRPLALTSSVAAVTAVVLAVLLRFRGRGA